MMLIVSRLYMQYENPTKLHAVTSDNRKFNLYPTTYFCIPIDFLFQIFNIILVIISKQFYRTYGQVDVERV